MDIYVIFLGGIIISVETFGELLVDLRKKNRVTQKNLANFIGYTAKQLHRVENNECIPSLDLVIQLSEFYKVDLLQYYKILVNDISLDSFLQFSKLRNAIEKADYSLVQILCDEYEHTPSFSYGENLRLIYYSKALCSLIHEKYNESLDYCIKGLGDYSEEICSNFLLKKIYSNTIYSLISCISYNFYYLGELDKYETILLELYENISNHFFNDSYIEHLNSRFIVRFYSTILNNISDLNIQKKKYHIALEFIEKAIKYSTELGNGLGILDSFYFTRFQCYYYLEQFKEALNSLDYSLMLSNIFNKRKDIRRHISSLNSTYPNILKYINYDDLSEKYCDI